MRNIKLEQNLDGDEHWPHMATVQVAGNPSAAPVAAGTAQPELETVIQSWNEIAVLRVSPDVEFYFGFMIDDQAQFLNVPVQTREGALGVHIGDADVTYFAFAKDMSTSLNLELVERVDQNDEHYADLPLY